MARQRQLQADQQRMQRTPARSTMTPQSQRAQQMGQAVYDSDTYIQFGPEERRAEILEELRNGCGGQGSQGPVAR
jgi:hypothetical protein